MIVNHDEVFEGLGRLVLYSRDQHRDYLSLYRYGAAGLATGSYLDFFLFHAPRAMFRSSVGGYLLRVETWVDPHDFEGSQLRCLRFLDSATPLLNELLQQ